MSGFLQNALEMTLSLFGLVFIVWVFWRSIKNSNDPAEILFKMLLSTGIIVGEILFIHPLFKHFTGGESALDYGLAFVVAGSVAACGITLGIIWTPQISGFLVSPLTDLFDGGKEPPEPKPYYSIALSKRKLSRPLEAVVAVREQLAKFPDDFEGVTLLATIQAEDMKDLPGAEITFDKFCNSENAPDKQIAAAWTQMADWHLKLAQDSDSARVSLNKIIAKYPDTKFSLAAAQRIAHLDGTVKQLLAPHDRHAMPVPEGVKNLGLRDSTVDLIPEENNPETLAADFVKHLEQHPLDTEAREKLAIIYARHYKRLDLAALELTQMIEQPNQPHKRVAHWLNLLAALQIHGGADYETVRDTLLKIIEMFPEMPVAEVARTRLNHLKLEIKGQSKSPENKTLGVYENNIGLKYGQAYGTPRQM